MESDSSEPPEKQYKKIDSKNEKGSKKNKKNKSTNPTKHSINVSNIFMPSWLFGDFLSSDEDIQHFLRIYNIRFLPFIGIVIFVILVLSKL